MNIIDPERIAEHVAPSPDLSMADQVANLIEMWTLARTVKAGDRFPAVRDLAAALDVSHKTARRCQIALKDRGLIYIEGNRSYCAGLKGPARQEAKKRYESMALTGILAIRETGANKEAVRKMVERAFAMERGPYAAV